MNVWPAYVIERLIMSKMQSIVGGMDVLDTLDQHMSLDENIKTTYVVMRMACADLMHVLGDHADAQLAVKHRVAKRVIAGYLAELEGRDMVAKPDAIWFTRRACRFVYELDAAMRGRPVDSVIKASEAVLTVTAVAEA